MVKREEILYSLVLIMQFSTQKSILIPQYQKQILKLSFQLFLTIQYN